MAGSRAGDFGIENRIVHALRVTADTATRAASFQLTPEELARHGKYAGPFDAAALAPAAWVFTNVHSERAGDLVEIGAIKEGVRQPVDESKRHLVARGFQGFIKQNALAVRNPVVGVETGSANNELLRRASSHTASRLDAGHSSPCRSNGRM